MSTGDEQSENLVDDLFREVDDQFKDLEREYEQARQHMAGGDQQTTVTSDAALEASNDRFELMSQVAELQAQIARQADELDERDRMLAELGDRIAGFEADVAQRDEMAHQLRTARQEALEEKREQARLSALLEARAAERQELTEVTRRLQNERDHAQELLATALSRFESAETELAKMADQLRHVEAAQDTAAQEHDARAHELIESRAEMKKLTDQLHELQKSVEAAEVRAEKAEGLAERRASESGYLNRRIDAMNEKLAAADEIDADAAQVRKELAMSERRVSELERQLAASEAEASAANAAVDAIAQRTSDYDELVARIELLQAERDEAWKAASGSGAASAAPAAESADTLSPDPGSQVSELAYRARELGSRRATEAAEAVPATAAESTEGEVTDSESADQGDEQLHLDELHDDDLDVIDADLAALSVLSDRADDDPVDPKDSSTEDPFTEDPFTEDPTTEDSGAPVDAPAISVPRIAVPFPSTEPDAEQEATGPESEVATADAPPADDEDAVVAAEDPTPPLGTPAVTMPLSGPPPEPADSAAPPAEEEASPQPAVAESPAPSLDMTTTPGGSGETSRAPSLDIGAVRKRAILPADLEPNTPEAVEFLLDQPGVVAIIDARSTCNRTGIRPSELFERLAAIRDHFDVPIEVVVTPVSTPVGGAPDLVAIGVHHVTGADTVADRIRAICMGLPPDQPLVVIAGDDHVRRAAIGQEANVVEPSAVLDIATAIAAAPADTEAEIDAIESDASDTAEIADPSHTDHDGATDTSD